MLSLSLSLKNCPIDCATGVSTSQYVVLSNVIPSFPDRLPRTAFCKEKSNVLGNQALNEKTKCRIQMTNIMRVNALDKNLPIASLRHDFCPLATG